MSNSATYLDIDRMMAEHELLLAFRGQITEETISRLLAMTEFRLLQTGEEKRLRKRIFSILVEVLQNIVNHSATEVDGEMPPSLLLMGRHENTFFIKTGNMIRMEDVPELEARLAEVNQHELHDVRSVYSQQLNDSTYSEKGGAGLGLLDIYKRSGNPIKHEVIRIDERTGFLSLNIEIISSS